jgi:hypothetical protein
MNRAFRAAAEAGAVAFAFAAMAVALLYITFGEFGVGSVIGTAAALGSLAGVTVFLSVLASVTSRFPGKSPVLGARRGAAIGVLAIVVVVSVHAAFTYGSGGFLYSLLWQLVYACLLGGGPVAAGGALFGCSIERRSALRGHGDSAEHVFHVGGTGGGGAARYPGLTGRRLTS